jgi:hypothetical protein
MENKIREAAQKATLVTQNDEFFETISKSEIKELQRGFQRIKGENENYVFRSLMTEKFPRFKKENYLFMNAKKNVKNFMVWVTSNLKENSGAVLLKAFYKEYMERKQWLSNLEAKLKKLEPLQIKALFLDVSQYLKEYMPNVSTDMPLNIDQPQTLIKMLSELPIQGFRVARRFVDSVTLKKPDLLYGKMIQFPVDIVSQYNQRCYAFSMFRRFFKPFVCLPEEQSPIQVNIWEDGTWAPKRPSTAPKTLSKWVLEPCETGLRAFAISTYPVGSNSGHVVMAIYNQILNEVEVFDSGGDRDCALYQNIIRKVFLGTDVKPRIVCGNPYDLQKENTDNGVENNFCQTFIYWFLYQKAVLKRKTKAIVKELKKKSVDSRFQLMQSFGQYIYNLGNQSPVASIKTKQQWIDLFGKFEKQFKTPVLPFLFANDVINAEDKMQLYKCMLLDVPLDELSESTKLTELTSCFIDVYLSTLPQERFNDIKKLLEKWAQWLPWFQEMKTKSMQQYFTLFAMKEPTFDFSDWTPETVQKAFFKSGLLMDDLKMKWNRFLKWQEETKEMRDQNEWTDKELVRYIKAKITERLISEKEKNKFQSIAFGQYEKKNFTTMLPYLDNDTAKEKIDLSVLNAILVSLDVLE